MLTRSIMASLAIVLFVTAMSAVAEEKAAPEKVAEDVATAITLDAEAIADMDGKELFRTFCKSCHGPDSEHGEYTPMFLIQEQWDEFFDDTLAETHQEATLEATGDRPVLEVLDEKALDKLHRFCVDHAADSEQPMNCG